MFHHIKIFVSTTLILLLVSCGGKESSTRIPVSTKSTEAETLLHEALKLNSISKGDEAKKKLLKAIEVDENQHKRYDDIAEHDRYNDLFMAYSGKWIFIRFNPDKFRDCAGILTNPTQNQRLQCLKIEINHQIKRILENSNTELLEIIHLFYDHT